MQGQPAVKDPSLMALVLDPRVRALIEALPRCCSCHELGVVTGRDRWVLCGKCWSEVPCGDEVPTVDLRPALRGLGLDV
jgi:hypothetical protein